MTNDKRSRISIFFRDQVEVILQVLFWTYYLLGLNVEWQSDWLSAELPEAQIRPLSAVIFPLVFFLNAYWLIPRFLKKKKWWQYGLSVLLLGPFLELIRSILMIAQTHGTAALFGPLFLKEFMGYRHINDAAFFGVIASCAYIFTKDWLKNIGVLERLKAEKLASELAFLKSQVDPHFLFNTLNSLYALALEENGSKTADGIAKLGTLMRYNLHDSQADFITLAKEVRYIEEYLALQELRTTGQNKIEWRLELDEHRCREIVIAPMLLIPFVENAFKHGISPVKPSFIRIRLALEVERLYFTVENSIIKKTSGLEQHRGVGIANVQQRLTLLYPDRHRLTLKESEEQFLIELELNLTEI